MTQPMSEREFVPVRIAVMTVSDTRTFEDDRSGDTLVARLTEAGHILVDREIVPDERDQIADALRAWTLDPDIDVILTTGGTGLTGRDVTVEAHRDVYEKEIELSPRSLPMSRCKKSARRCAKPGHWWGGQWHLSLCVAGVDGRVQGRLGRNSVLPTRLQA